MQWLNYHHLLYFWMAVREGGIQAASKRLRLAHPTVSVQIKQLEEALGVTLFDRSHRKLELTETGRVAYRYADEIFSLGNEMLDVLGGAPSDRPMELSVGISDVMPKLVTRNLLEPALELETPVRLICSEDRFDRLLAGLATHSLDVVLSDTPCPPSSGVKAFNHLLGECGITFFAHPRLAPKLRRTFPRSLTGAPVLMPAQTTSVGRAVLQWCEAEGLRPNVVAEFDDSALMKTFGQDGVGAFPIPSVVEEEVKKEVEKEEVKRMCLF